MSSMTSHFATHNVIDDVATATNVIDDVTLCKYNNTINVIDDGVRCNTNVIDESARYNKQCHR